MQIKSVLVSLCFCVVTAGCDEVSRNGGSCGSSASTTKLIGGAVDSSQLFKSFFSMETNDGLCTGVKVASDLILTAAHCAMDTATAKALDGKISLTNGVETKTLEGATIKEVIVEPKYLVCVQQKKKFEECQGPDSGDLAFIRLTPQKNGQFVQAASLTNHLEAVADNSVITFVGYGCETRESDREGVSGENPRRKYGARQASDFYTSDEYGFSKSYFAFLFPVNPADAAVCAGDSGAPVFVQKEGAYQVAGITSFNIEGDGGSGLDGFVNLSYFKKFIADEIAKSPATTTGESCQ